ncbi:lactonase family protein [Ilyomonas limi]|nr:lactonase family protein [Ilyomonas limi]
MIRYFLTIIFFAVVMNVSAQNPIFYLLIGTYTNAPSKSEGIYVYKFNPNKAEATFISKATGVVNPSYLAITKDQKYVYAVNETQSDNGGDVSAFSFDKQKGELHFINKQPSGGDDPAYISVDSAGKWAVAANYSGGNIGVLPTGADGALQPAAQILPHEGYGVNVERQGQPHPHSVVFSPNEKYLYSCDLGNDRIYTYSFDPNNKQTPFTPADPAYIEVPDGSGPRHITFHPNGQYAYVINELSGNVIAYQYNSSNGKLTEIQTIESTTEGSKTDKGSADIHLTPDGKFLYTSNRGAANDITIYKTSPDGKLILVGHQKVGAHPRNFMIDPTGRFLLVACRDSNQVQVYVINKNFGLLQDAGLKIDIDQPVCLKMMPVK